MFEKEHPEIKWTPIDVSEVVAWMPLPEPYKDE